MLDVTIIHRSILLLILLLAHLFTENTLIVSSPLSSFYHDIIPICEYNSVICSPILKRGAGARDAFFLSDFVIINIFLSLYNYLYIYIGNKLYIY